MKKLKMILLSCLLAVCLAWGMIPTAMAQETSQVLMELAEPSDMVVCMLYERQEPPVVVTAPDGTEYGESLGNIRVERGNNATYFYLPDAQTGRWLVRYDGQNSGRVQFICNPYTESIYISSFTAEAAEGNRVRARFQADFPSQVTYNYEIFAVLTDGSGNITGKRSLERGTARSGEQTERLISLDSLSTYDGYQFQLEVWYKKYTLETGDSRVAQGSFSAGAGSQPQAMAGVDVEIDFEKGLVYLDWEQYRVSCDHYVAAVRNSANTSEEPDEYRTVESGEHQMTATLPENCSSITVELTYVQSNGRASQTYRREIPLDQAECTLQTPENTSSAQAVIHYRMPGRILANLQVNGSAQAIELENEGDFSASLEEGRNEVVLACAMDGMTDFVYRFRIYSDRIAPVLKLYEDIDGITVDSGSFLLTGETENGCRLTINGAEQTVGADGTFQAELSLKSGENRIEIQATDPAGNQTRQSAVIFRGTPEAAAQAWSEGGSGEGTGGLSSIAGGYGPLLLTAWIAVMASLLAVIGLLIAGRKPGRGLETAAGTARNLCFFFALISGAACGWFWLQAERAAEAAGSQAFLKAAEVSISSAYEMLEQGERFRSWTAIAAVLTAVFLVWSIMAWILKLTARRRAAAKGEGRKGGLGAAIACIAFLLLLGSGIFVLYWFYGEMFWG